MNWQDYIFGMAVNVVLTTIAGAIKDPLKAAQFKRALLKVRDAINGLYPPDTTD
jgi:hypothetical protein